MVFAPYTINTPEIIYESRCRVAIAENKLKEWTDTFPYRTPSDITLSLNELQTKLAIEKGETKEQGSQTELTLAEIDAMDKIAFDIVNKFEKSDIITDEEKQYDLLFRLQAIERGVDRFADDKKHLLEAGSNVKGILESLNKELEQKTINEKQLEAKVVDLEKQLERAYSEYQKQLIEKSKDIEQTRKQVEEINKLYEDSNLTIIDCKEKIKKKNTLILILNANFINTKKTMEEQISSLKEKLVPNETEKRLLLYTRWDWIGSEEQMQQELSLDEDWKQLRDNYKEIRYTLLSLVSDSLAKIQLQEEIREKNVIISQEKKDSQELEEHVKYLKVVAQDRQKMLNDSLKDYSQLQTRFRLVNEQQQELKNSFYDINKKVKNEHDIIVDIKNAILENKKAHNIIWGRSWLGFYQWLLDDIVDTTRDNFLKKEIEDKYPYLKSTPQTYVGSMSALVNSLTRFLHANPLSKYPLFANSFSFKRYDDEKGVIDLIGMDFNKLKKGSWFSMDECIRDESKDFITEIDSLFQEYREQTPKGFIKRRVWGDFCEWLVQNMDDFDEIHKKVADYVIKVIDHKYMFLSVGEFDESLSVDEILSGFTKKPHDINTDNKSGYFDEIPTIAKELFLKWQNNYPLLSTSEESLSKDDEQFLRFVLKCTLDLYQQKHSFEEISNLQRIDSYATNIFEELKNFIAIIIGWNNSLSKLEKKNVSLSYKSTNDRLEIFDNRLKEINYLTQLLQMYRQSRALTFRLTKKSSNIENIKKLLDQHIKVNDMQIIGFDLNDLENEGKTIDINNLMNQNKDYVHQNLQYILLNFSLFSLRKLQDPQNNPSKKIDLLFNDKGDVQNPPLKHYKLNNSYFTLISDNNNSNLIETETMVQKNTSNLFRTKITI